MTTFEKLTADMKEAMKAGDAVVRDTIRMTISAIKNKAIELNKDLEETETVAVVKAEVKKLKDSIESFVTNAREDLAEKVQQEVAVLEKYLPAQMSDEELELKVRAKIEEMGGAAATQAGKVMGSLAKELREVADGARIKTLVDKFFPKS